jgi:type II secretory pathway component PulJ
MDRRPDLASRITLGFTLLAVLVALSAWLAWRSHAQTHVAQSQWQRASDWHTQLLHVERLANVTVGRTLCAAGGVAAQGASAGAASGHLTWVEPMNQALAKGLAI